MALLECLLAVGMALSLASTATAEEHEAVQQVTGPLPWEQSFHYTEDHDGYLTPQNPKLVSVRHGIAKDMSQTALIQNQSDILTSMFKSLEKPYQECDATYGCTAGTLCCWIPEDKRDRQQCVKMVSTESDFYINSDTREDSSSKDVHIKTLEFKKRYPQSLQVLVLPVGQGDCVAMYCPNGHLVMFDCGSNSPQDAFNVTELRYAILGGNTVQSVTIFISHGDKDHYSYLPHLFPAVKGTRVIIGGHPREYKLLQTWLQNIASTSELYTINNSKECIGDCNDKLYKMKYQGQWTNGDPEKINSNICGITDIRFDIIAANVENKKLKTTTNEKSIVLKVTGGGRSVLLSGDIEGNVTDHLANIPQNSGVLKSDVYQISHHGACSKANKCPWLEAIRPEEAFVSHAFHWRHSHPRCDAIRNLLGLKTIVTGDNIHQSPHQFMCMDDSETIRQGKTCHHIFSTYPARNKICTVRFFLQTPPATSYRCYLISRKHSRENSGK